MQIYNGHTTTLKFQVQNSKGWHITPPGSVPWIARLRSNKLFLSSKERVAPHAALKRLLSRQQWLLSKARASDLNAEAGSARDKDHVHQCFTTVDANGVARFEDIELVAP